MPKSIRLIAVNRPELPHQEELLEIVTKLGSIGYRISLHDAHIAWTDYSRARHPTPIVTDDGREWIFAEVPRHPHDIMKAVKPFVRPANRSPRRPGTGQPDQRSH